MVQLCRQDPTMVYMVLDGDVRSAGWWRPPASRCWARGRKRCSCGGDPARVAGRGRRLKRFRAVRGSGSRCPRFPYPADPHASFLDPRARPPARRRRLRGRPRPRGARSPARAAPSPAITPADLKVRISIFADDSMLGRRAGTVGQRARQRLHRGRARAARPQARRRRRRLPAAGAARQLRARHRPDHAPRRRERAGCRSRTTIPTSRPSRCRPARSTAPRSSTSAPRPTRPRWPSREALQGKLVVFRSSGDGQLARRARPGSAGSARAGRGHRRHRHRSADRPVRRLPARARASRSRQATRRRPA